MRRDNASSGDGGELWLPWLMRDRLVEERHNGRTEYYIDLRVGMDAGDTAILRRDFTGKPLSVEQYGLHSRPADCSYQAIRLFVLLMSAKRVSMLKNARQQRFWLATKRLLEKLRFFEYTGFDPANYLRVKRRPYKGLVCKERHIDVYIDDKGACAVLLDPRTTFLWYDPTFNDLERWWWHFISRKEQGKFNFEVVDHWRAIARYVVGLIPPSYLALVISSRLPEEQKEIRQLLKSLIG